MDLSNLKSKPTFVIVVASILALCFVWIIIYMVSSGPNYRASNHPPTDPLHLAAGKLSDQIHESERLKMVFASVDPSNPKRLKISGEVFEEADLDTLNERLKQIHPDDSLDVDVEVLHHRH